MSGLITDLDDKALKSTGAEKIVNTNAISGKMINKANTNKLMLVANLTPIAR